MSQSILSNVLARGSSAVALGVLLCGAGTSACSAALEDTPADSRLAEALNAGGASGVTGIPPQYKLVVADDFEHGGWWFFTSQDGHGYVSARPGALSGNRVADEYGKNPIGQGEELGKSFALDHVPSDCFVSVAIKPLRPVTVSLETVDFSTRKRTRVSTFQPKFPAEGEGWQRFDNVVSVQKNQLTSSNVSVRLTLEGSGEWQEALFDDLNVYCD